MRTINAYSSTIELSEKIESLPKAFVELALSHITDNKSFWYNGLAKWHMRLMDIKMFDRWEIGKYAITLKYSFAKPYCESRCQDIDFCFKNGLIEYDTCYIDLIVAKTVPELMIKLNLEYGFPVELNYLVAHWNKCGLL